MSITIDECDRREMGIKMFGETFMCHGNWIYTFPIGHGETVVEPKCQTCPYYYPGVVMY